MIRNLILVAGLATAMAVSAGAQAQQSNKVDNATKKFVTNAIEGDLAEIAVGKLALDKGLNADAKQFGQMLVKDHSEHKEKAVQLAKQLGIDPPSGPSISQKATYLKLKMLTGATFDRSFASSMLKDHQADIKEYQKQSERNDQIGQFAKETLPTLREHLKTAQSLQQKVQNEKTSSR
jgi:putative membrane protein